MADMHIFWTVLQLAWIVAFIAIGFFTIRFIVRRSRLLGGIVVAGTLVHVIVGALLFSISWLDMPILRGVHTGDGFWVLAPDARMYFNTAAKASTEGLQSIPYGSASPTFVSTIAVWMDLTGVNPASPLLFNLIAFVLTCGLIVRFGTSGDDAAPPGAVLWPLVTLSFSPTLLFCSTQVLKDVMFACLVAVVALATRELVTRLDRRQRRPSAAALAGGIIGLFGGVYVIAGIRAYYAVFIWLSLAATFALFLFRQRRAYVKHYLGLTGLTLATLWLTFMIGAGPYYSYYHNVAVGSFNTMTGGVLSSMVDRLSKLKVPGSAGGSTGSTQTNAGQAVDNLREGFVLSAGQTNLIRKPPAAPPAAPKDPTKPAQDLGPSRWEQLMDKLYGLTLGLVAMFVPLSLLQALSIVDIQGGRGFLYLTDLDTLFIDASILGITWLLYRERKALAHRRGYLCFCLAVALLSTVLLAYVVTNLGTLFRLRLIALMPFWMAPLAIARISGKTAVETEEASSVSRETPRDPALSPV